MSADFLTPFVHRVEFLWGPSIECFSLSLSEALQSIDTHLNQPQSFNCLPRAAILL